MTLTTTIAIKERVADPVALHEWINTLLVTEDSPAVIEYHPGNKNGLFNDMDQRARVLMWTDFKSKGGLIASGYENPEREARFVIHLDTPYSWREPDTRMGGEEIHMDIINQLAIKFAELGLTWSFNDESSARWFGPSTMEAGFDEMWRSANGAHASPRPPFRSTY